MGTYSSFAQILGPFRSGVFLHHSTGECIWGPNGSTTSVPDEMTKYNYLHGYTNNDSVTLSEQGWPVNPWNNEWERWHRIFDNEDTIEADIRPILVDNPIIIIKSCFPSSGMRDIGSPSDTLTPEAKTMYNYKWHWRNFIRIMQQHPGNFFVVWTNAPLVDTNSYPAMLSDIFCRWAKDTLANGLDPQFGLFPSNVYVFDFFHKLAGPDGKLPLEYAASESDSHPNAAATELVAPQFVQEVFDAAINYESLQGIESIDENRPLEFQLLQNYPNPFNPLTKISYLLSHAGHVKITIMDMLGREITTLVNERKQSGSFTEPWNAEGIPSGVYFYRLQFENKSQVKKLSLLK